MAFNAYGTPLKKTGIPALTDIYKKKTEPNTWAGGSYGRGYMERTYNMNPSAMGYKDGYVTINDNPLYKASLVNGKAMINESEIPSFQNAIDTYAKRTGFATPDYNPNTDNVYQMYKSANEQAGDKIARRTAAGTMANLNGMTGGYNSSFGVGAATQAGAAAANPYYQRSVDILPEMEQNYYNRNQANREWLANQKTQNLQNTYQELQNKYYAPNMNSQLEGQNLQNVYQGLQNKYYVPQAEANIAQTKAQTANIYADNSARAATAAQKQAAKDPFSIATPQQRNMYNEYSNIFYATPGNEYYNNPDRVYQRLVGRPDIAEDVGQDIYNYMVNQAGTAASKVATIKEPNSSNFYSSYIDKNFTKKVKDEDTEEVSTVQDDNKILNYLENLSRNGVDDNTIRSLLSKYGLPTD